MLGSDFYLHLFQTSSAHDAVYEGSGYSEPWVGHVVQTGDVSYNKVIDYGNTVGSIVYVDGGGRVRGCLPASWSSSLGTPIAVVVVPSSHMADGRCRAVSLCNMSYVTPETGTLATYSTSGDDVTYGFGLRWGEPAVALSGLSYYTGYAVQPGYGTSTSYNGYMASDLFSSGDGASFSSDSDEDNRARYMYYPYGSGGPNPNYARVGLDNAFSDMDGLSNTLLIVSNSQVSSQVSGSFSNVDANYPAAMACHIFRTVGTVQGSWYLPTIGEVGYLFAKQKLLNSTLSVLGQQAVLLGTSSNFSSHGVGLVTSTVFTGANTPFGSISATTGYVSTQSASVFYTTMRVRAFCSFDL